MLQGCVCGSRREPRIDLSEPRLSYTCLGAVASGGLRVAERACKCECSPQPTHREVTGSETDRKSPGPASNVSDGLSDNEVPNIPCSTAHSPFGTWLML